MRLPCRLRVLRADRTLSEISAVSGVSESDLSKIERGIMLPRDDHVPGLAAAYDAPLVDWYPPRVRAALLPEVTPGQVWIDNDRRHEGRTLTVIEVTWLAGDEVAVCKAHPSGRQVVIRTDRFRPTSTGYRQQGATVA